MAQLKTPQKRLSPALAVGGALTGLLVVTALTALFWTPYAPDRVDIAARLLAPSPAHLLGTDQLGRDILSMLMKASYSALLAAFLAVGLGVGLGAPLGLFAAFKEGALDDAAMYLSDFLFAFPALLVAVMLTALYGPGVMNAVIAIGVFNIAVFARLTRAAARTLWQRDYVLAARALGLRPWQITLRHILPNIAGLLLTQITVQLAVSILAEAGLSYLGLGARLEEPSWGRMLFEAQSLIYLAPHTVLAPGLAIFVAVLGLNLLGDGLREAMDIKPASQLF